MNKLLIITGLVLTFLSCKKDTPVNSDTQPNQNNANSANFYLYGVNANGGALGYGDIFVCNKAGIIISLDEFTQNTGQQPSGTPIIGRDGQLYGTTQVGGLYGKGTIFRMSDTAGFLTTLANFDGSSNGGYPDYSVIQGSDGNLYGTTSEGQGTIFKCTVSGILTTLVSFNGNNGATPYCTLMQGTDGSLYGMTENGGLYNDGTIFKCTLSGTLITLASFDGSNGSAPYGNGLMQANDGNLYGMTANGGSHKCGTIFKCTTSGTLTTLVSFDSINGSYPSGSLIQATDGNLYGTAGFVIFRCTTSGNLTSIAYLDSYTGSSLGGTLVQCSDGNLYGTTGSTVFQCTTGGMFNTIGTFNNTNGGGGQAYSLFQSKVSLQ